MEATARIFFQKAPAKKTKNNLTPVKLCITHNRKRRYYSIAKKIKKSEWLFLSESEINKVTADSPRGIYRDMAFEYKRIADEAQKIIGEIPTFSFNQFDEKFFNKVQSWDNVFAAMIDHIQALRADERFGYASSFESTIRAMKEFHENKIFDFSVRERVEHRYEKYKSGKSLYFVDITTGWLKNFESELQKQGKSKSTIGIYMRNIRVLFNIALKVHKINAEYPFDNYTPKTAKGRKIALSALQINLIASYQTEDPQEQFYRDLFMFSFLGNGMNLSDIARLRYSNIQDGEICFVREKTKLEENEEDILSVPVTKIMQNIIERYGTRAVGFDSFIFPILKTEWSEQKKYAQIKELTKRLNKYIRRIALKVGVNEKISSYSARHSWATIAKNSGTSTEFISESLGHSNVNVTKRYLKGFEKSTRTEHSEKMEDAIYNQKAV
jgi:integrase/recombinase XerD